MKLLLAIARIFVGVLFIFSGLVKANDPLGLSYKMQEYFEVWHWYFLNDYALAFALVMNVFEIVAGIAVLVGWRMKLFGWLLLLLIIFFTFLTGYAAFSGKIAACGCFGDCIPLKPIQSFWKDVILFVLILFLLINYRKIKSVVSSRVAMIILIVSTLLVSIFQWYVLEHLPVVDCLPYKKGNDLLEQMKTPPGFVADEYAYTFLYEKNGKKYEFNESNLPADIDTYTFIDTKQKLVKKGNDLKARITDFNLVTDSGTDTTQALLSSPGKYILIFSNETDPKVWTSKKYDQKYWVELSKQVPVYIVTSVPVYITGLITLKCDNTVIKTAARANPTYFVMQGAKVLGKFSYAQAEKVTELLK
jgi:uncharacterized membrane protein YphA (DoxX/SURF4 family)